MSLFRVRLSYIHNYNHYFYTLAVYMPTVWLHDIGLVHRVLLNVNFEFLTLNTS